MVIFESSLSIALVVIAIASGLTLVRLYRGPTFADRVIVFDLISAAVIALFAALSLRLERSYLLDAAIMVSLLSFLGTVGFASYLERSETEPENEPKKEDSK